MRKPESVFINSVHAHLPVDLYRMKNHNEYNAGIADCWYDDRLDLWAEYKFIVVPARPKTVIKPDLSPLQLKWLTDRRNNGRNVVVIVGCKAGGVILHHRQWLALTTAEFKAQLQSRKDIAEWIEQFVADSDNARTFAPPCSPPKNSRPRTHKAGP